MLVVMSKTSEINNYWCEFHIKQIFFKMANGSADQQFAIKCQLIELAQNDYIRTHDDAF